MELVTPRINDHLSLLTNTSDSQDPIGYSSGLVPNQFSSCRMSGNLPPQLQDRLAPSQDSDGPTIS